MGRAYQWERESIYGDRDDRGPRGSSFAVLVSVIIGVLLFSGLLFAMSELKVLLGLEEPKEITSREFELQDVELVSQAPPEIEEESFELEEIDAAELLTEIEELIPELDDSELDISPEISQPEVELSANIPLESGEEFGEVLEPVAAPRIDNVLDQIGKTENFFPESSVEQILVEEGSVRADIVDPDELLKDMRKQGSGGLSADGLPSGYASIDGLLNMATSELTRSRAALPSDLLFEYDSAELRETARLGLMKLAMLIDRNSEMFCIIEGHADLFGPARYNLNLSQSRADSVRNWLVESMYLNGDRIIVRAYGSTAPKVLEGSIEEQAINRRVDILMRNEVPPPLQLQLSPEQEEVAEIPSENPASKIPSEPEPTREPVEEDSKPLRALPIDEEEKQRPLRALPID